MGWETINGRRYFYETVYEDGKRIRYCRGCSIEAMRAAERVEKERKANADDLALVRAYQLRDQQIDRKVADLAALTNHALQQQLIPHGFHWTNGRWRKRRFGRRKPIMSENSQTNLLQLPGQPQIALAQTDESSQATELLGDEVRRLALESLRDLNAKKQDGHHVRLDCMVEQTVEEVKTKIAQLRQELQYEEANIFDRLLIEQLLSAWVQWYVASWLLNGELPINRTWRQNQYFERRYQLCHTRLAKAIDQLTKVRQISPSCLTIVTKAEKEARAERARESKAKWEAEFAAMNAQAEEESRFGGASRDVAETTEAEEDEDES